MNGWMNVIQISILFNSIALSLSHSLYHFAHILLPLFDESIVTPERSAEQRKLHASAAAAISAHYEIVQKVSCVKSCAEQVCRRHCCLLSSCVGYVLSVSVRCYFFCCSLLALHFLAFLLSIVALVRSPVFLHKSSTTGDYVKHLNGYYDK